MKGTYIEIEWGKERCTKNFDRDKNVSWESGHLADQEKRVRGQAALYERCSDYTASSAPRFEPCTLTIVSLCLSASYLASIGFLMQPQISNTKMNFKFLVIINFHLSKTILAWGSYLFVCLCLSKSDICYVEWMFIGCNYRLHPSFNCPATNFGPILLGRINSVLCLNTVQC
jgi:hypothetical protein